MENPNNTGLCKETIFSDFFYQDERAFPDKNYVDINAHELTHQWFGDYITAWSGSSH